VIRPDIERADQGQTLIANAWAVDSSNQLIASCASVLVDAALSARTRTRCSHADRLRTPSLAQTRPVIVRLSGRRLCADVEPDKLSMSGGRSAGQGPGKVGGQGCDLQLCSL